MTEPRIYMHHVRQLSGAQGVTCAPSIRAWCEEHDIDLRAFTHEGVPGERLLEIGGYFALTVMDIARKEAAHG